MQRKWLYRLILSYIPILFAVIFCLMMLFFLTISQTVKKQSVQASKVFVGQAMNVIDSTLQNIDTMTSKNLLLNDKVSDFFISTGEQSSYADYQVTEVLLDFMAPLPMIDSVYLYRKTDGKVLMQHFSSDIEQFGDHDFIMKAMNKSKLIMWSEIRNLNLFGEANQTKNVVSLVKRVPYYSGEQGLIIVNVRAASLQALLTEIDREGEARLCLTDQSGKSFFSQGRACSDGEGGSTRSDATALASAYTGWRLHSVLSKAGLFPYISAFSYVWFTLGLIAVIGGIAAMTYISHRHYRPIEQLLGRIYTFSEKKQSFIQIKAEEDEFSFIGKALESLIEQTNYYEKLQAEGIVSRRVYFFKEVMEGTRAISNVSWSNEAESFGLGGKLDYAAAAIVEIDNYAAFAAEYSARDQSLFNFTVRSVIQEIADEEGEQLWTEWVSPGRLGLLYQCKDGGMERHMQLRIKMMAEKARDWVEKHLTFTVTFGIGDSVKEAAALSQSYKQAVTAVERKLLLGPNRVYVYDSQWRLLSEGTRPERLLQELGETAGLFRLGNSGWEPMLDQSFQTMATGLYSKEEVIGFIRLFATQIHRELQELPQPFQELLKSDAFSRIITISDGFEWIGDVRSLIVPSLRELEESMNALRMIREQYTVATQVKRYIADNFANPNLSLAQVSEVFDLNQKTLSRIFKEETGDKFVDCLARERIEQAKRMLIETTDSVQLISEKVGYLYPMSFIRIFKKLTATTPGDFRREYASRSE